MSIETVMWTVLPTGNEGRTLKFSLYLSPQLGATAALGAGSFPSFRVWTDRAKSLAVTLEIAGIATPLSADLNLAPLSTPHWTRIFPDRTPVRAWGFTDQTTRTVQSYPVTTTRALVGALYDAVATNPALATAHPPLTPGSVVFDFVNAVGSLWNRLLEQRQAIGAKGDPNNLQLDRIATDLLAANPLAALYYRPWRFFNRPQGALGPGEVPPPVSLPDWDFHQAVAMLVDHGSLLRLLGLVIDGTVTVPPDVVLPSASLIRIASAKLTDGGPAPDLKRPWTNYLINGAGFLPRPKKGSDIENGMLRLADKTAFDVYEIDADGAALKTLDFAVNMSRFITTTATQQADKPDSAALPALRTGGFTLSRRGRGDLVKAQFGTLASYDAAPDSAQLWADDVTRGYRIDVHFRGNWFPLCRRQGKVWVGPPADPLAVSVDDEGYVKGPSGTSTRNPGVTVDELYLHEAVFTWKGWSLSANRPGRTIPQPPATDVVQPVNTAGTSFQVVTDFHAAPKTLPRLRFGELYRFRARTVDLAGNSVPPGVTLPGAYWESAESPYLRYEPIATPVLVPRAAYREGEALENLSVRSQIAHLHPPLDPGLFNDDNQRHVLPPKGAQLMAEEHGRFDPFFASDPALAFRIGCKELGTLLDRQIVDPYATGFDPHTFPAQLVDVADIALVDPSTTPSTEIAAGDNAKWPVRRGDPPLVPGEYVVHKGTAVALPYLPDPLAQGLALRFPDGSLHFHPFVGAWPDVAPFRLVLAKGPLGFSAAGGVVTISLPEGTMLTVRFSTLPNPEALATMMFARALTGALRAQALRGQHWMLTPYRDLHLVHAVEQPMEEPHITLLRAAKALGNTYATLFGSVHTHANSTGEVDVFAHWTDPVDRLKDDAPTTEEHDGYVFSRKIGYAEVDATFPAPAQRATPPRHEFGDTKHRLVKYRPLATTRYREYFPASVTALPANITWEGGAFPVAPTAFIDILSSARPEPPRVLYIVPTFRWEKSPDGLTSTRVGRGLRIYLDRPWYSSGAGELLGIVLPTTPISAATMESIRPYVSEWGADPAGNDTPPGQELRPANFLNQAIAPLNDVGIAEKDGVLVRVAGFAVAYNADRKLWFCDIDMDPGNLYFPFVRLAIARLQPDSVLAPQDVRLSHVVKTEFAQLTADRSATLSLSPTAIDIAVSGLTSLDEVALTLPVPIPLPIPLPVPVPIPGAGNVAGNAVSGDAPLVALPVALRLPGGFRLNAQAGAGHLLKAHVERRTPSQRVDGKDPLGWSQVGAELVLASYTRGGSAEVFWRGSLPFTSRDPGFDYRVVILEYELIYTDPGLGPNPPVFNPVALPIGQRLVYLDTIPITP